MSGYRQAQIYVNYKTVSRLRLIGKLTTISADEVADKLLNEKINETYPELKRLEKDWDHTEEEYLNEIRTRLAENQTNELLRYQLELKEAEITKLREEIATKDELLQTLGEDCCKLGEHIAKLQEKNVNLRKLLNAEAMNKPICPKCGGEQHVLGRGADSYTRECWVCGHVARYAYKTLSSREVGAQTKQERKQK